MCTLIKFSLTALLFFWLLCFVAGCAKYNREGFLPEPGVALTFDDSYIDEWYQQINLFDSFDVKATFYISNYNTFSPEQKRKLHALEDHGHEIAFHTTNHPNLVQYLTQNGIEKLMDNEINEGMSLMKQDGFHPTTFAYPYGRSTPKLDEVLLKQFKSVRVLNGSTDIAKSCAPANGSDKLYAIGMDLSSGKSNQQLVKYIQTAYENDNCLVLVGHHVERPDLKMQVPLERLKEIIKAVKARHMRFYTASEISRD